MTKYLLKCKYVTLQGNRDDIEEFQDEAEVQEFLKKYGSHYQEITVYKVISIKLLTSNPFGGHSNATENSEHSGVCQRNDDAFGHRNRQEIRRLPYT